MLSSELAIVTLSSAGFSAVFSRTIIWLFKKGIFIFALMTFTLELSGDETNQPDSTIIFGNWKTNHVSDCMPSTNGLIIANNGKPRKLSEVKGASVGVTALLNNTRTWKAYDVAVIKLMADSYGQLRKEIPYIGTPSSWVTIEFHVLQDGEITDLKPMFGETNSLFTDLCVKAIKDCSPFPKWDVPKDERLVRSTDFRKMHFTFYANESPALRELMLSR